MQSSSARSTLLFFQSRKSFTIILFLVILVVIGLSAYSAFKVAQVESPPQPQIFLTQQMLAEQYGLGVNLVAVTAAGGMVDLRLRIIDGEKARALLSDQANFPTLRLDGDVVLQASQDVARQQIKFENGSNIFVLYPNAQNAVKPGAPVSIVFGYIQVEPIPAK